MRPSSLRTGMLCRLGASELRRPVRATVWLNVAWMRPSGPTFVHVTHDPDRTWAQIGPYVLHEAQTYAQIQTGGQHSAPMVTAETLDELRASPQVLVGTPDDVLAAAGAVASGGALTFNPLAGGLPPDLAWSSLELFAAEVLPRLRPGG